MLLRYLWSNPFHLMVSLHRLSQFSKPQFLFKHQTLREKQLLALSCQEINQYVSCVWFFTSREGVVGFLPFFGVAFTDPYSLCSPTLTLGGVNAGSPEALNRSPQPESTWPVCELWVTFYFLTTPGWKHVNLQTLPRLQIRVAAEKRVERQLVRPLWFFPLMQFHFCDVSFSDVIFPCIVSFIWRLRRHQFLKCTTRWRTRRRRTKTPKKQQLAVIRNGESSSPFIWRLRRLQFLKFTTRWRTRRRQTKNTQKHQLHLSVMRNQILHHRLVVCMWK